MASQQPRRRSSQQQTNNVPDLSQSVPEYNLVPQSIVPYPPWQLVRTTSSVPAHLYNTGVLGFLVGAPPNMLPAYPMAATSVVERLLLEARLQHISDHQRRNTMMLAAAATEAAISGSAVGGASGIVIPQQARRTAAPYAAVVGSSSLTPPLHYSTEVVLSGSTHDDTTIPPSNNRRRDHEEEQPARPPPSWESMFDELDMYRRRNGGSCLLKERDFPKLGRWIRNQKKLKRQGKLSPERVRRLESIGINWNSTYNETWNIMFRRLEAFKQRHGHCMVPRKYKEDPKLGRWVDTQRNRDREEMGQERLQRLNDIGFVWNVHDRTWNSMFQRLCAFKAKFGHCLVPSICTDDPKLGSWIHVQRSRKEFLPKDRIERLNQIGFAWCASEPKRNDQG